MIDIPDLDCELRETAADRLREPAALPT